MLLNIMKIATNIILAAIAIVLAVNILSNIEKSQVDTIKETFSIEKAREFQESINTYTLIPKTFGLDTIKVQAQSTEQLVVDKVMYGERISEHTEYMVFVVNNRIRYAVSMNDYELQK